MRFFSKKRSSGDNQNSSILDQYSNKVFRLVVLIVPVFFLCGNGAMTIMHYLGMYDAVNDIAMWISNAIDISFMGVSIYLVKTSYGPDGLLIPTKLPVAKMVLMVLVVLQWNLNSYICPFTDFWAYAPLFVIVQAFFFDLKLVHWSTLLITISMVISWVLNGEHLLPAQDEFFVLNLMFRGICLTFTLLSINIVTWFGKVFIIEVVAIREKEREMREKSDAYEREARLKSDFLANMSHEIRTPMNAVIGMAEIAMREELPPVAKDCLAQIQKSGRNLLNIINDILDYSKIESGKMEIVSERFEPSSEMNDISNILATRIEDKELSLFFVIDKNMPHALLGDAMRIRQILINLVNNAIKFTERGSVGVIIEFESTGEDMINLTFRVFDTGIGIKKEDMDKLFVNFQQIDSRRNRSVEGTGLGLAISQRLVENMGGTIGVESEYGKGSQFWFTIPLKVLDPTADLFVEDAEKKRAVIINKNPYSVQSFLGEMDSFGVKGESIVSLSEFKPDPDYKNYLVIEYRGYDDEVRDYLKQHPDVNGIVIIDFHSNFKPDLDNLNTMRRPISTHKIVRALNDLDEDARQFEETYTVNFTAPDAKILIVDDNEINISIAKGLLAPMEMKVDAALSGPEAIVKLQKEDYDIVLMDHMMPEMDGVDTTKIIREEIKPKDELVIIALSANALKEAREMFLESGMNDFVAKPIEIKELVAKIRKWLPEEKIHKGPVKKIAKEDKSSDPLKDFYMLDTKHAVKSLGSPELLRSIVEEYYKAGIGNYEGIKEAYDKEDVKDFTIRVHALKSSSRQIGALELGDRAEALEKAGKNEDIDFIKANTDELLDKYKELIDSLSHVFPESEDDADLPLISDEDLKALLEKLKTACDDFDMDAMDEIGKEIKEHSWPDYAKDDLTTLCDAIDRMEIITCEEIVDKIM